MRIIILISGVVLLVTCISFFAYEFYVFRKTTTEKLSTIGKIISTNSTAALAFDDSENAKEILAALKAEPHIVAAALYNKDGELFSKYSADRRDTNFFPKKPQQDGYRYIRSHIDGFEPILQDERRLGTLYLRSDLGGMYDRFRVFGVVAILVIFLSFILAYLLSMILQKSISKPILTLSETAKVISNQKDYSVRAVKSGNDEVGGLTNAFNNMLEEIEKQNKTLSEFNKNLEQKVSDRTEQLETVNKELESFSYSISHDLRAPLRGVVGFAAILEEDYGNKLDDEGKRIISVIKNNTLKMGRLIDDLLTFSRMSRQDIMRTNIATNKMVRDVIEDLVPGDKKPAIHWDIQNLPDLKGDINAIRQVWVNLISNAVKYSATKKQPQIEIGSFKSNGQTVLYIKDNGVGFDEKYKNKLFQVFQRLHSEQDFEGTGIGLAIIKKIISKHGGHVWAEGEKDKGACFSFSLSDNENI